MHFFIERGENAVLICKVVYYNHAKLYIQDVYGILKYICDKYRYGRSVLLHNERERGDGGVGGGGGGRPHIHIQLRGGAGWRR